MRYEDDTFEVMSRPSRCVRIMSNLTQKIINRKSLRRLCKYIIVIFEYFLTAENFPKTTHQDKEWSITENVEKWNF
jgi:hypothetical protein